jgi:hypothetical protein
LDEIESNIKQARKELASFARRVATDKIIMVFACLVVCGIIAVIVYSIVDPSADTNVPDQFKPTTSQPISKRDLEYLLQLPE